MIIHYSNLWFFIFQAILQFSLSSDFAAYWHLEYLDPVLLAIHDLWIQLRELLELEVATFKMLLLLHFWGCFLDGRGSGIAVTEVMKASCYWRWIQWTRSWSSWCLLLWTLALHFWRCTLDVAAILIAALQLSDIRLLILFCRTGSCIYNRLTKLKNRFHVWFFLCKSKTVRFVRTKYIANSVCFNAKNWTELNCGHPYICRNLTCTLCTCIYYMTDVLCGGWGKLLTFYYFLISDEEG